MATEDETWMGQALLVAKQGLDAGELPIGAIVVLDGVVIGGSFTQERTQGRLLVHAELLALGMADRTLKRRRRDAVLYTTLEPCLGCLGAAMSVMVGSVVFGLASPTDGATELVSGWGDERVTGSFPGSRVPEIRGGVLHEESRHLFADYLKRAGIEDPMAVWARTLVGT